MNNSVKIFPLICPCEAKQQLTKVYCGFICTLDKCEHSNESNAFPLHNLKPILISTSRTDTVCILNGQENYVDRPITKYQGIIKRLTPESEVTVNNCRRFVDELHKISERPKVLVIGGGQKGSGTDILWNNKSIEIHSIDIYYSESVDIICDAHYLPLMSKSYDGVWIQAVLEHVVEPARVVEEIFRVLNLNGIVYAETPFMQQVHEGAYDFTRYTILGHRYLFKKFEQ
jgi:SAM-dependent methyltransferase